MHTQKDEIQMAMDAAIILNSNKPYTLRNFSPSSLKQYRMKRKKKNTIAFESRRRNRR